MPAIDPTTITPTLARVGQENLRRTKNGRGTPLGTFTADTTPTDEGAQIHIAAAARQVALDLGNAVTTWTGNLLEAAKDAVAIDAAWRIERACPTPDSVIVMSLEKQRDAAVSALIQTARNNQSGGRRYWSATNKTI